MLLVPLVLGPTSRASGSLALGLFLNSSSPLPTRNSFPWWWKHMSGGRSDAKSMSCFVHTMRPWSTCWIRGFQRFHPSCNSSAIFYSPQHDVASLFSSTHPRCLQSNCWCSFSFLLADILTAGPRCSTNPNTDSSPASVGIDQFSLEQQCHAFLMHGLAPSTRNTYATAQRKFFNFCLQLGQLHSSGSPCPSNEWTLCLFATILARFVHHSTIKVYLSGFRALHVEQGLPDPLQNCLHFQRVVRGIKVSQGSSSSNRLPITDSHMLFISKSLNMHLLDHCMFWAACKPGYFGFLRAAEFTVPNLASFCSSIRLTVQDIAVYGASSPPCMRVTIKASKTDPFR